MHKFYVFFLVLVIAFSSLCAQQPQKNINVDLRSEFGPIRDQGDMGFCYAFATADLLSYWLNTTGGFKGTKRDTKTKENMVSGLAYALSYNNEARREMLQKFAITKNLSKEQLGKLAQQYEDEAEKTRKEALAILDRDNLPENSAIFMKDKIFFSLIQQISEQEKIDRVQKVQPLIVKMNKSVQMSYTLREAISNPNFLSEPMGGDLSFKVDLGKYGVCFEKDIPSEMSQHIVSPVIGIYGLNKGEVKWTINYPSTFLKNLYSTKRNEKNIKVCAQSNLAKNVFPTMRKELLKNLLEKSKRKENFDMVAKILNKACYSYKKFKTYAPTIGGYFVVIGADESKNMLSNDISNLLKKSIPMYIGYDSRIFDVDYSMFSDQIESTHASLIVGMRYNPSTSKEEYIIRNSWGPKSCEEGLQEYDPLTKAQQEFLFEQASDEYEECYCNYDNYDGNKNNLSACIDAVSNKYFSKKEAIIKKSTKPYRCENGYYIVEKNVLLNVVQNIAWLDDSKLHNKEEEKNNNDAI